MFLHKRIPSVQFLGLEIPFLGIPGHSLRNNSNSMPFLLISLQFWRIWSILNKEATSQPQPPEQHTKESNCRHFLKVNLHNKMINLSGILRSRHGKDTVPVLLFFEHNEPPIISYIQAYQDIGPSVFNVKKVIESVNLSSDKYTTCKCSLSVFYYQ